MRSWQSASRSSPFEINDRQRNTGRRCRPLALPFVPVSLHTTRAFAAFAYCSVSLYLRRASAMRIRRAQLGARGELPPPSAAGPLVPSRYGPFWMLKGIIPFATEIAARAARQRGCCGRTNPSRQPGPTLRVGDGRVSGERP